MSGQPPISNSPPKPTQVANRDPPRAEFDGAEFDEAEIRSNVGLLKKLLRKKLDKNGGKYGSKESDWETLIDMWEEVLRELQGDSGSQETQNPTPEGSGSLRSGSDGLSSRKPAFEAAPVIVSLDGSAGDCVNAA